MRKQITLLAVAFCILFSFPTHASYKKVKVIGSIKSSQTKHASSAKQRKALDDAKSKALDKYIAGLDSQRVRILNKVKDDLHKNINTYVLEVVPLDDGYWENGYWNVNTEATINEAQIEELVNKYSQGNIKKREEQYLAFVFIARETDSVLKHKNTQRDTYDYGEAYNTKNKDHDTKTEQDEPTSTIHSTTKTSVTESNVEKTGHMETTSGGTIEKKSDSIKYKTYTSEDLDNKVTEIFNKADFDVVPSFEAGIDTNSFIYDFVGKNNISQPTQMAAINAAKGKGINYLAVGSLDVGEQLVDEATGLQKAYVRVNAYILNLNDKFTKKVCSVGPVQYSGVGEDPMVAKTNALINAGTAAAKDLVDQLRVKQGLN